MLKASITTIMLLLSAAQSARAATLYSAPMTLKLGESMECKVTNLDKKAHQVEIRLLTNGGFDASDFVSPPISIPSGQSAGFEVGAEVCLSPQEPPPPPGPCFPTRCVVEVDGGQKTVRASVCLKVNGTCVTALELR